METALKSAMSARPVLRGVVFDMDGTLTVPNLDFSEMYRRCGVPKSEDILEAVAAMDEARRREANTIIEDMEEEGRRTLQLATGVGQLAEWLQKNGIRTALVTRNTTRTVQHFHRALWEPSGLAPFWPVIARDDGSGLPPKPNPAALHAISAEWQVPLGPELLMVGDSPANDIVFGKAAGVRTALVDSGRKHTEGKTDCSPDFVVESLETLPALLQDAYGVLPASPLQKFSAPEPSTAAGAAARAGEVQRLDLLPLDEINEQDAAGNTPLIWAADAGQLEAVKVILGRSAASLNMRGYLGATALSRACRRGYVDVLRELLAQPDVKPEIPNVKQQYPMHFAAFKQHREAIDLLLEHGASTTVVDRKGRTPAEDTSDDGIRGAILKERALRAHVVGASNDQ
eukprot:TRINITY_DN11472_c0_g1_i2.p1 TRINITY_DN11472_c0_g1~~TRINITY_DN11472_c0_g1_i2.p1  ORF type:complete len:400 (-),score=81.43 TRINITY_DN11472_c0_g1_i2:147-1346(-)